MPRLKPFISATRSSFHSSTRTLDAPTWPSARPRTISASTCVPALPPMPATIGISTASATIFSIVPSNWPTTLAARNAVPRLIASQSRRRRNARGTGLNRSSSSSRPAAPSAWCSACSRMMSTTSSMVMRPSRMLLSSTTGAVIQSWSENWRATSSADSSTPIAGCSSSISWLIGVPGFVREQRLQRDAAEVLVAPADDVQVVGVVGQFAAQAQVAQHDVDGGVGAHRHHVGVHQAAGGVLVVGQHLLQALAVLAVHRLEDFVDDRVRQVFDQVGEVVDVEVFDRGDDLVRVHVGEQAFAHVVADVDQHFAVVLGIDQAPHHRALGRRQRFEQVADLRRRQRVDQAAHGAEAAAVERVRQQTQLARGLVVADGFGHAGLPLARRTRGRDRVRRSWRELCACAG